jgi:hypothetical protein
MTVKPDETRTWAKPAPTTPRPQPAPRAKPKLTQAQKLDDALSDAEMFLGSAAGELADALAEMRKALHQIRMRRLTLARAIKRAEAKP